MVLVSVVVSHDGRARSNGKHVGVGVVDDCGSPRS